MFLLNNLNDDDMMHPHDYRHHNYIIPIIFISTMAYIVEFLYGYLGPPQSISVSSPSLIPLLHDEHIPTLILLDDATQVAFSKDANGHIERVEVNVWLQSNDVKQL